MPRSGHCRDENHGPALSHGAFLSSEKPRRRLRLLDRQAGAFDREDRQEGEFVPHELVRVVRTRRSAMVSPVVKGCQRGSLWYKNLDEKLIIALK
jgi:hypothetical protein